MQAWFWSFFEEDELVSWLARQVVWVEAELDGEWMQMWMYGRADAVEGPVHHLKSSDDADRSFCGLGSGCGNKRLALGDRIAGTARAEGIGEGDQLRAEWQARRGAGRNRRKVKVEANRVATRTEKRCVGEQSIEALVEIRRAGRQELDLRLGQRIGELAVSDRLEVDVHRLVQVS